MFFASVAHELRTPLNSIIPLTHSLEKYVKEERGKQLIDIIKSSSQFLANVIEDALDMSRIENNKFTLFEDYFDLPKTLKEVSDIMKF